MATKFNGSEPVRAAYILCGFALLVVVLWKAHSALLVLSAGILTAAIFASLADSLQRIVPAPRAVSITVVYFLVFTVLMAALLWGGIQLVSQFDELAQLMSDGRDALDDYVSELTRGDTGIELPSKISSYLPDIGNLVDSARSTINMTLGAIGNVLLVLVIGAFVAWDPKLYGRGMVSMFPPQKRDRLRETISESSTEIRHWIAGQSVSMLVIFTVSWLLLWLINMPFAFLLALQAGLLAFIPTIGPFIAGIPMLLVGITVSPQMMLIALAVYLAIQTVESNLIMPLVQRKATSLPPALTLGFQIFLGALFGFAGLVMAVPVLVVTVVFIRSLYVEDVLGGPVSQA